MTDDIEREDEWVLTAEYVLGLLTPEEAAAYEEVLAVDPDLRAEYAFMAERIARLTDDLPDATPPRDMLARIERTLFDAPGTGARPGLLARLGLVPSMLAGLAAAVAVLWLLDALPMGAPPVATDRPTLQAQIAAEDGSLAVLAVYDPEAGLLRLERTAGAPAPADRAQELWLIAGDAAPVSLGLLGSGEVSELAIAPDRREALSGGVLAISDEPAGGSPSGAPTGPVLAAGEVISL